MRQNLTTQDSSHPLQNRVTPYGEIIAVESRGTLMGNRGCLHDENQQIRRHHVGRRWILCVLQFKGRHRQIMAPQWYTELFFLDEATGFAAGHRPCGECQTAPGRREGRYNLFRDLWATVNGSGDTRHLPSAEAMDTVLHTERIGAKGAKQTYRAPLESLPNGTMVTAVAGEFDNQPYLVHGSILLPWEPGGYGVAHPRSGSGTVNVLTPPSIVRILAAGYPVGVHETAASQQIAS